MHVTGYKLYGREIRWYFPDGSSKIVEGGGFETAAKAFKGVLRQAINEGWTPPSHLETWRRGETYWIWMEAERAYANRIFGGEANKPIQEHFSALLQTGPYTRKS